MSRDLIDGDVVKRDLVCKTEAWCGAGWWVTDIRPPH